MEPAKQPVAVRVTRKETRELEKPWHKSPVALPKIDRRRRGRRPNLSDSAPVMGTAIIMAT
jgi:hypothetical protein